MLTNIGSTQLWIEDDGDGTPVIMIHGLGGTTTFYDAVTERLAPNYRTVRYDLTGHGRSPLQGQVSIEGWADQVGQILDHLGADKAHLIAHSMGTVIAQQFAAKNPDRVTSLTLLGPIRELPDGGRDGLRQRAATVRDGGIGGVATAVAAGGTGLGTKTDRPEIVGYARESVLRQNEEGYAAACEALASSADADQSTITMPVCVITGSDDGLAPPDKAQRIADGFADAELHVIDQIGHWTVIEAGKQVGELIATFLNRRD